jgi:hypothetical protein
VKSLFADPGVQPRAPVSFLRWSPDGRTIAFAESKDGRHGWCSPIQLVDVASGKVHEGSPGPMILSHAAWRARRD